MAESEQSMGMGDQQGTNPNQGGAQQAADSARNAVQQSGNVPKIKIGSKVLYFPLKTELLTSGKPRLAFVEEVEDEKVGQAQLAIFTGGSPHVIKNKAGVLPRQFDELGAYEPIDDEDEEDEDTEDESEDTEDESDNQ